MSLDDKTLQRLHDEDLEPEEAQRIRAELGDEDRQRIASLEQMRLLIRAEAEAAAGAVELDGLWEAVQARVATDHPASGWERWKVWLSESMGAHPFRWVTAGAAAAAVAVLLAVVLTSMWSTGPTQKKDTQAKIEVPTDDLDIERLEFKGRHPDIYEIKDGMRKTTVIWVHPDEEDDDDKGADADDNGSAGPI